MTDHVDFAAVFRSGCRFRAEDGVVVVRTRELGKLALPSGRVVACDPLSAFETTPFAFAVPVGTHDVFAAIATFANGDRRVAAAMVRFSDREIRSWTLATRADQDASTLGPGQFFGYGVDAGTGCFADASVAAELERPEIQDWLATELDRTYEPTWSHATFRRDDASVVAFSSGWGDGSYASFWGHDAAGNIVALATDFAVLVESVTRSVRVDGLHAPTGTTFSDGGLEELGVALKRCGTPDGVDDGISFEVTSTRSVELVPVDGDGEPIAVGSTVRGEGPRAIHTLHPEGPLQASATLDVRVLVGLRTLPREFDA